METVTRSSFEPGLLIEKVGKPFEMATQINEGSYVLWDIFGEKANERRLVYEACVIFDKTEKRHFVREFRGNERLGDDDYSPQGREKAFKLAEVGAKNYANTYMLGRDLQRQ